MAALGDYYSGLLENYYSSGFSDIALLFTITLLLILAVLSIRQIYRYNRLKDAISIDLKELKRQDIAIKKIDEELKKLGMDGSEELEHWSKIEQELSEFYKLPSLTETDNEIILRMHISPTRKDYVDVAATEHTIDVNISDKISPLRSSYATPKKIDPSNLSVTYKGNTLEIHAPKIT